MLKGHQSWQFANKPVMISYAAVVGPDEGAGPLGNEFDIVHGDTRLEEDSWEKAERKLMEEAAQLALKKANLKPEDITVYFGGDLMNQIISTSFASRKLSVPYMGLFSACAVSMQGLALAALAVDSGFARYAMAGTCSHNSTVEKQYRYPTEYGSQKPPTAQYTVTGAGAAILAASGMGPVVTRATIGRIVDMGLKDPFNMGAAMAPAAVDTIQAHFRDFGLDPEYYDLIVTGDLSTVGYDIACELFERNGFPIGNTAFQDCGIMIYDREKQPFVQAGASGAACSAAVTYGHLMKRMERGELNRILVAATGALLSPLSYQQGESIPCVCHAVAIERQEGGQA